MMQDRFKFRVWHKRRKRIYEILHLHVGNYENGGDWATVKGYNIISQQDMHIQVQPKDCVIMQCTGLKDKNGKLIYEGDIVKETLYRAGTICDETYLAVVHDGCIFRFEPDMVFTDLYYHHHKVEVVGNIYENPELLNKEE